MGEDNRFRKKEIRVKLSVEEYDLLQYKAETTKRTMSDVIRDLAIYGSINAKWLDESSFALVSELNEILKKQTTNMIEIGNNINQIAYNSNSKYEATEIDMRESLKSLQEIYYLYMEFIEELREKYNADNPYS